MAKGTYISASNSGVCFSTTPLFGGGVSIGPFKSAAEALGNSVSHLTPSQITELLAAHDEAVLEGWLDD